uniref:DUF5018 domain-containing protein n=1 Tax=uncultured bacterium contig00054 TaxID=1181538 RepID=A0A806KGW4_9BACT|nr:hypothetical protein [uncultured bacterium contig00054]
MKNSIKLLGLLALAAVIAFSMTACDEGGGEKSDAKAITHFYFPSPVDEEGVIDEDAKTVSVNVPHGTDVTALTPSVTVSPKASYSPKGAQDFSSPVTYTVSAEDGTKQDYTVTVTAASAGASSAKAMLAFSFSSPEATGVIDESAKTVSVHVPHGTAVTSLTPTVTVSPKASYTPHGAQNFTSPVVYRVTAEDASHVEYTVTVTITPAPTGGISLTPSGNHIFTEAHTGYGEQTPYEVTINNDVSHATGALTIALSGANPGSFTLSTTTISDIAANGNASFTVKPNTGLAAGTYTATVTISGANSIHAEFDVSFTVSVPVTYSVTFVLLGGNISGNTANVVTSGIVSGGTVASLPTNPIKENCTFGGWWYGINGQGTQFTTSTTVSANTTVYAKWTMITPKVYFGSYLPPNSLFDGTQFTLDSGVFNTGKVERLLNGEVTTSIIHNDYYGFIGDEAFSEDGGLGIMYTLENQNTVSGSVLYINIAGFYFIATPKSSGDINIRNAAGISVYPSGTWNRDEITINSISYYIHYSSPLLNLNTIDYSIQM